MAGIEFKGKVCMPSTKELHQFIDPGTPIQFTHTEKVPEKFMKQREAEILDSSWKQKVSCPTWYLRLKASGASEKEIFEKLLAEIRKAPTEANLWDANMILLEMAKSDEGKKVLKTSFTPALLREFQRGGDAYAR